MEANLSKDPFEQFRIWFEEAKRCPGIGLAEAMCLSTVGSGGLPTARMMLLKDCERDGFTFFTNIHSPKAKALLEHPRAALTFHWGPLQRQVRIEGIIQRLDKRVADAYFATRPRWSQIGAWASRQSQPLKSRFTLMQQFRAWQRRFKDQKVPAPPHWAGFQVNPVRMEFWQGRPYRLHDRFLYLKSKTNRWTATRLYP